MAAERLASTTEPEPFRPKPPRATHAAVADGCRVAGATAASDDHVRGLFAAVSAEPSRALASGFHGSRR